MKNRRHRTGDGGQCTVERRTEERRMERMKDRGGLRTGDGGEENEKEEDE